MRVDGRAQQLLGKERITVRPRAHGVQHQRRQQTGAVATLQMIEGAAGTIVTVEPGEANFSVSVVGLSTMPAAFKRPT